MKLKKCMAVVTTGSLLLTAVSGNPVLAEAMEEMKEPDFIEEAVLLEEQPDFQRTIEAGPEEVGESEIAQQSSAETEKPKVTNLKAEYNERTNQVTLTWEMTQNSYAKIYVNNELLEDDYKRNAYVYEIPLDGMEYKFEVVPYDEDSDAEGESMETSVSIGYKAAAVEDIEIDYDLDKKVLIIDWSGENIKYADVYQDDVKIAEKTTEDRVLMEIALEPMSKHIYKVVPYNFNNEEGTAKTAELQVEDYTARIEEYDIEYNEETKQIVMEWEANHTAYVDISINEEEIVSEYGSNRYVINYQLQSGAKYDVVITPYNQIGEDGESVTESIQNGEFETPFLEGLKEKSIAVTDAEGNYTGFHKPAVEIRWEGEENAVYELYRAEKDKKSAYHYITSVKTAKEGLCTYLDKNIGIGDYYYKIRKIIKEDDYIIQEIATALSDSEIISIEVPRASIQAELAENDAVKVTLNAKKDYVSGYEIYRKDGSGKYRKIATVTENTYWDKKVNFETMYGYKARAYYYDGKTGKKKYGGYSKTVNVKSTLGEVNVKAVALSDKKMKISWNAAANAEGYKVYYKSGVQGDGYILLKDTQKLSFTKKLKSGREYTFLVKAYKKNETGEVYFSSSEVTFKTGFSKPKGFKVQNTEYEFDEEKKVLMQRNILSWNRVYGAEGYYVERYNEITKRYETVAKIKKEKTTCYTIENVVSKDAKVVKYRISAYSGEKVISGGTLKIKPELGRTSEVKVKKAGSTVNVSWKTVKGAEKYNVYRSNGRTMVLLGTTDKLKMKDKGLSLGVTYTYYVQAVNESMGYCGNYSKGVNFGMHPKRVTKLTAVNRESGAAVLKWSEVSEADAYIIYYSDEKDGVYQKLAEIKAGNTTYTHTKLAIDTTYFYKMVAVKLNAGGIKSKSKFSPIAQVYIEK